MDAKLAPTPVQSPPAPSNVPRRLGRPPSAVGPFLRLVTVNDVYKLDNYPRVAAAIKEFKLTSAEDSAVVISCLPGDFLSPCTLTNLDGGAAMLKALNVVPIDYVMFGNHEFDLKGPQLQKRIKEYKGTWINSNVTFPEFTDRHGRKLPPYEIVKVGARKVAFAAFCLDDMSQFAPVEPMPKIEPPVESVAATWTKIKEAEGSVDAFLPMLHLNIKEDRVFADFVSKHAEMAKVTPLLLAAHDHEVYIEQAGKCLIFKVGMDAENIGVIDLFWDSEGSLRRNVHMLQASDFPKESGVQTFVDKQLKMMDDLMNVNICEVPNLGKKLSTAHVRFQMEPMVSFLLTVVKHSMPNVDIVVLQGGNVRGGTPDYQPGPFKYGDLMKEFAFETQMAIVRLPGDIIEASIRATRIGDGAKPFFLHCDDDAVFASSDTGLKLELINGEAFDPARNYTVGTYQFLLAGMGNIEPLTGYCKAQGICPPLESCLPIKTYFMETCMRAAWRSVLECGNEMLSEQQFEDQINRVFDKIDIDKNGRLDAAEVAAYVEKTGGSSKIVSFLIKCFDVDGDGMLDRAEVQSIIPHHPS